MPADANGPGVRNASTKDGESVAAKFLRECRAALCSTIAGSAGGRYPQALTMVDEKRRKSSRCEVMMVWRISRFRLV